MLYLAHDAQKDYQEVLSEAHSGISIGKEDIERIEALAKPLVLKGQSIHSICARHRNEIMLSEKTFYNYVDRSLFSFRNIDLPRKVRYRPRKSRHDSFKCERSCRVGRTYGDFLSFVSENPDVPIVEMDTVEGRKGGKVLLTIHFTASKFMLAFIRDANTAQSATDIFASLRSNLGNDLFMRLFPVLLTDNGSEFTAPREIEVDCDGELTTRVFYCDPSRPDQKGAAENNHEMIRKILPKSTPLDNLSQQDINKMMNHINSYARKILNDRTPFDAFRFFYGEDALKILGAELILPDDVTLRPSLFL
jgi:IS30 family transposase